MIIFFVSKGFFIDYKASNAETLSTNDQSVFDSHHSLIEKPLYSFCKKEETNPVRKFSFDPKENVANNLKNTASSLNFQKNNYFNNLEKSSEFCKFT